MPANLENSAVATGLEKVSFHSNSKEKHCQRMFKLLHNCTHLTIALISYTSKVMLKILQARLQQYVNHELPDVQARFRKEIKLPTSIRSSKKQESSRKLSTSATPKPLTVWITTNCGKFFKRWEYQTTLPAFWETCMQVKKQQLELDMEQRFQIGKGIRQDCILSPCLFNLYVEHIMQRKQWQPTPVFLPGKSDGWRSLVGCNPRGH